MGGMEKRTLRGMFVKPGKQVLWCAFLSAGFFVQAIFLLIVMTRIQDSIEQLRLTYHLDSDSAALLTGDVLGYLRIAFTLAVSFAFGALIVGLVLSHRVFGPMVPILAHVRALIGGKYDSRARLRKSDEFADLVTELNALAETLQAGSSAARPPAPGD